MIGGDLPDYDLDPPWISKDEDWEEKELRRIEDDIDRDQERSRLAENGVLLRFTGDDWRRMVKR